MSEHLWTLLCTACEVEKESLNALRKCIGSAVNPAARAKLNAHLSETRWQMKLLDACLDINGVDKGRFERGVARLVPKISRENLLTIKCAEIDLYEKIIFIARKGHTPDVLQACREILEQERAMAEWIEDNHMLVNISFSAVA